MVLDPLGPPTLDVELRVDAGVQGAVLRLPIKIPINGSTVLRQPPRLLGEAPPTVVSPGRILLRLDATDDRRVSSITTWLDSDKIAWQAGTGKKTRMELPVEIPPGPHSLVVMVEDDEGARTRRVFHVRGVDSVPANAPSPPP